MYVIIKKKWIITLLFNAQGNSCDSDNLKMELLQTPQIIQAPTRGIVMN